MKAIFPKIKVVDLFSGAGGLTFGFTHKIINNRFVKDDSFDVVFANDFCKEAAKAFSLNFPSIRIINDSIESLNKVFFETNGIDIKGVDIVIGGPPCQSYSTIGKRKNDDRSKLYKEYRRILEIIQPKMFIFENVLGILSFKDEQKNKIIETIKRDFDDIGFDINIKILNAKDFGVPQNRLRVFLVGIRKESGIIWEFPAFKLNKEITVNEAIGDLPELNYGETSFEYRCKPTNKYQSLMRGNNKIVYEHTAKKYGPRIRAIIENLGPGEKHDDINKKVEANLLPADLFLTSGYNNSYARLWGDKPSATITNNFGTPSSNRCIHPVQNRALSLREAARLQSFPDNFVFYGNYSQKAKQVGNAVPPLLAIHLSTAVKKALGRGE